MNDPDAHGSTRPVSITTDDVYYAASATDLVVEELDDTVTIIDACHDTVTYLTGWESAGAVSRTASQWKSKSDALLHGPKGLADFANSLRQFVADVTTVDTANTTGLETAIGVQSEFGGEYAPAAPSGLVNQLVSGEQPR